MRKFLQNEDLLLLMIIVAGITALLTCVGAWMYKGLLSEKKEKARKGNQLKKEMIRKLETYYKLQRKMHSMEHFVDHYLYEYHYMGLALETWENITFYGAMAIIMIEIVGSLFGLSFHMTGDWYLRMAIVAASTIACIGITDVIFGNHGKKDRLRMQLLDFLENTVLAKLELAADPKGMAYYKTYFTKKGTVDSDLNPKEEEEPANWNEAYKEMAAETEQDIKEEPAMLLDEILKEYL